MNKKFRKQLLKLLIPYMLIIIFLFIVSSIAYAISINKIESNRLEMEKQYIQQSKLVLDRHFEEVFHIIYQLKNTPTIKDFSVKDEDDIEEDYSPVIKLKTAMNNLQIVNKMVSNYYIFYRKSKLAASHEGLFVYKFFDNESFLYRVDDKMEFWESLFDKYYHVEIQDPENFKEGKYQTIPIKSTIGYGINYYDAVIYLQMSSEKIRENMVGYGQNFDGNFLIVDEKGRVLVSLNNNYGIVEGEYFDIDSLEDEILIERVSSDVIPYNYVLIQSSEQVYDEINKFRNRAYIFLIVVFIAGMVILAFIARYNTKPVIKLMDNNEQLAERVEKQLPYLRMIFLEKWLKGNYVKIEEIISITKFLKTKYIGNYYGVAVIDYHEHIDIFDEGNELEIQETEAKKIIINDILTEEVLRPEFIHTIDNNKLAVIFIGDCNKKEELKNIINEKMLKCDKALAKVDITEVHYGISNIYDDMSGVPIALTEALDAITFSNAKCQDRIIWYEDIEVKQDICYYPYELEYRLFNCVRAGDRNQVVNVIRELLQKNIVEKNLNRQMQRLFINEMCGTLVKLQQRALGDDSIVIEIINNGFEKMKTMSDLEQIQYCKQIFLEVCDVYSSKQEERHRLLMERIDNFIMKNFSDSNFGLSSIADEFKVSYTYLSEIIKEYKGMSFINYLQYLRMNEAKRLLVETDLQVKDIYSICGYNSGNSFGKAFKRIHGVTASAYREKYRKEKAYK